MIPDDVVDQVREAADIVQIIGEFVNLKRTGSDFRGPCPFHQGTHRNFSVSPKKEMYYCFVCKEGGDVFDFLRKRLGLDFVDAVKHVASRSGIEVREVESRRDEADEREPLWEINASAAEYFRSLLWNEEAGRAARDYLALRRVSREVSDRFGLGFAPREPDAMQTHLVAIGFGEERLLEAGLLYRKEDSGELRPRFRNRLVFPILDASGHHVGFGGRLLGPGEPKYLNSAESAIFSKARLLYGLSWAKNSIRREDRVMIVEGYFDVVRLVTAGFDWVVAPLGTALTDRQAALLRRYTRNAFLLYDSDRPGLQATFRSGDELLRQGFAVQVVTLPEGEDPDSFVDKHGADKLREQLASSIDVFERKVQLLERAGWFSVLQKKRRALDRLLPTIRATTDPLTRDLYVARASEASGVTKELLQREADEGSERDARVARTRPAAAAAPVERPRVGERRTRERRRGGSAMSAERELLRVMLLHGQQVEPLSERIGLDDLRDPSHREIFHALLTHGGDAPPAEVAADLSTEASETMQELLEEPDAIVDVQRTVDECLAQLHARKLRRRLREIDDLLGIASPAEKDSLIGEKRTLVRELQALGVRSGPYGKSRT
ncbi:MAG TPA: DNA primase [Gemmatimonadaceae bacterium]|nr:DNA primase [Gemmatimonadaceae bacterium]